MTHCFSRALLTPSHTPRFCSSPISLPEKHGIFSKLGTKYSSFSDGTFTEKSSDSGRVNAVADRPGLLVSGVDCVQGSLLSLVWPQVSSTSWTEDEDFSVLLEALDKYEASRNAEPTAYPRLVCVITGKGPLKEHYRV